MGNAYTQWKEDYKDPLDEIIKRLKVTDEEKSNYCQYRGKDVYCMATSHKSCRGCRFFCPTTIKKLELILKDRKELEKTIKKQEKVIQTYMRISVNQERANRDEKARHKEEVKEKVKKVNRRYGSKLQFKMY